MTGVVIWPCGEDATTGSTIPPDSSKLKRKGPVASWRSGATWVAKIDVTFISGQSPAGDIEGPSAVLVADKAAFGSERIRRWFGRTWHATGRHSPPA
jgi:hypothetical protein